jgi:hypothetical protein
VSDAKKIKKQEEVSEESSLNEEVEIDKANADEESCVHVHLS